jgi:glycosyltransferase involved in cell wall biosynthesis
MRHAALIAVPSEAREGLSMVALEAQAMGVPVAGFSGSGLSEAVAHNETGLLVSQGDEGALADEIIALLKDEGLATRMGTAGRQRMERLFDLRRQTALLEDKYDEVLRRG